MKTFSFHSGNPMTSTQRMIICLCLSIVLIGSIAVSAVSLKPRSSESFDANWKFCAGELPGAEQPGYHDTGWRTVNVPHDWSIEGLSLPETIGDDAPELSVVKGEWKFHKGDDTLWKQPTFQDESWQRVMLPSTWEASSNYTEDNVYGWYRREVTVPANLSGKDIILNVGKIDDADETYFNGVKVGGLGHFPPAYVSAWDIGRFYRVPHELIRYGEKNSIAVRVFDGISGGGMYDDGARIKEGIFESLSPGGGGAGYINAGTGWYRKAFSLPSGLKDKRVFIEFDGVYMNSDVWLNGRHLGNRPYGYSSFQYELTKDLKFGGEKNILAVRARVQQPCSRWYSGAGIYRHVRLTVTDPVHIAQWGTTITTPVVTKESSTVRIATQIENQSGRNQTVLLETVISDADGHIVARTRATRALSADSTCSIDQTVNVRAPRLWSTARPTLYSAASNLSVNGRLVDAGVTRFGIRTIEFTVDKGFFLNGEHVQIKGVCLHHDQGWLGSAVRTRALERQLEIMKEMGCNAVRTSHNPPAPEFLDLCDRMGVLVMDEAFDEWKRGKTMYGYGRFFDEWSQRDLTDMLRRDRNHPSIILWSIGNEIPEQDSPNAFEMSNRLVEICHREDPTRPVTSACNTSEAAVASGFSRPLDVLGINYSLSQYQALKGTARLVASETASAVSTRGAYNLVLEHDTLRIENRLNNQCSAYDDSIAEATLRSVKQAPWVAGEFVWTGFDYIGEPSPFPWPSVSSYFGIVDLCGFPKDRFYLYQSMWTTTPMVHVFPHWNWKGWEGREIPVWCYSNCESVELFLNGTSLGEKKFSETNRMHLAWNVKYAPGTLKVVAKKNGIPQCVDEIHTTGAPAKIILSPDRRVIRATGEDLSYVKIQIVDSQGRVCPDADNAVTVDIQGEGVVAGMGNGNPVSHEDFKTNTRKAFHGLCLAVIESTHKRGPIHLTAKSEGLAGADVVIDAR